MSSNFDVARYPCVVDNIQGPSTMLLGEECSYATTANFIPFSSGVRKRHPYPVEAFIDPEKIKDCVPCAYSPWYRDNAGMEPAAGHLRLAWEGQKDVSFLCGSYIDLSSVAPKDSVLNKEHPVVFMWFNWKSTYGSDLIGCFANVNSKTRVMFNVRYFSLRDYLTGLRGEPAAATYLGHYWYWDVVNSSDLQNIKDVFYLLGDKTAIESCFSERWGDGQPNTKEAWKSKWPLIDAEMRDKYSGTRSCSIIPHARYLIFSIDDRESDHSPFNGIWYMHFLDAPNDIITGTDGGQGKSFSARFRFKAINGSDKYLCRNVLETNVGGAEEGKSYFVSGPVPDVSFPNRFTVYFSDCVKSDPAASGPTNKFESGGAKTISTKNTPALSTFFCTTLWKKLCVGHDTDCVLFDKVWDGGNLKISASPVPWNNGFTNGASVERGGHIFGISGSMRPYMLTPTDTEQGYKYTDLGNVRGCYDYVVQNADREGKVPRVFYDAWNDNVVFAWQRKEVAATPAEPYFSLAFSGVSIDASNYQWTLLGGPDVNAGTYSSGNLVYGKPGGKEQGKDSLCLVAPGRLGLITVDSIWKYKYDSFYETPALYMGDPDSVKHFLYITIYGGVIATVLKNAETVTNLRMKAWTDSHEVTRDWTTIPHGYGEAVFGDQPFDAQNGMEALYKCRLGLRGRWLKVSLEVVGGCDNYALQQFSIAYISLKKMF